MRNLSTIASERGGGDFISYKLVHLPDHQRYEPLHIWCGWPCGEECRLFLSAFFSHTKPTVVMHVLCHRNHHQISHWGQQPHAILRFSGFTAYWSPESISRTMSLEVPRPRLRPVLRNWVRLGMGLRVKHGCVTDFADDLSFCGQFTMWGSWKYHCHGPWIKSTLWLFNIAMENGWFSH